MDQRKVRTWYTVSFHSTKANTKSGMTLKRMNVLTITVDTTSILMSRLLSEYNKFCQPLWAVGAMCTRKETITIKPNI